MENQSSVLGDGQRYRAQSFSLQTSAEADTFAHSLEEQLARSLRYACDNVPIGSDISQSECFRDVTSAFEFYLPAVLREVHAFWKHESLDGVFHELATKTGRGRPKSWDSVF